MPTTLNEVIIPVDLASRWELIVNEATKRLFAKRKEIKKAIGARPYKGLPVDENELRGRVLQVRQDPQALFEVLAGNAKFSPEGGVKLPKELVKKFIEVEKEFQKGVISEQPQEDPNATV